jgi:hypothetical protein
VSLAIFEMCDVNVAGTKGGRREIIRDNEGDNEYNIKIKQNKIEQQQQNGFEECQVTPGESPEKAHLAPRLKWPMK